MWKMITVFSPPVKHDFKQYFGFITSFFRLGQLKTDITKNIGIEYYIASYEIES